MTHRKINYRDNARNLKENIPDIYPLYKRDGREMHHPNTIKQLDGIYRHSRVTGASHDVLSMRSLRRREKKSARHAQYRQFIPPHRQKRR